MSFWNIKRFYLDMFTPMEHDKPYFGRSFESYDAYVHYVRNYQNWFLTLWRGERHLLSRFSDPDLREVLYKEALRKRDSSYRQTRIRLYGGGA